MKRILKIFPSRLEISPYDMGDNPTFEKKLSVFSKVTFDYEFSAFSYREEDRTMVLSRNISPKITDDKFFKSLTIEDHTDYFDEYDEVEFECVNKPRDSVQQEAIDFLYGGSTFSDFSFMSEEDEKMLCLATGKGKTYSVIAYLARAKKLGMIVVDQDHIMKQWFDEFLNHTNLNEEDIFLISGLDTIKALLRAEGDLPFKAYIASHRTFATLAKKRNGVELLNALFNKLKIATKVFDEAHVEWKNIILMNSYIDTKETIYLTATPNRSNAQEDIVYQYIFGEVPRFGLQQKYDADEKYQDLVFIEYDTEPSIQEQAEMKNRHGFDMKKYSDYIQEKHFDYIYEIIDEIIKNHNSSKVAIIAHKNEFVDKLATRLETEFKEKTVGRFCGLVPKSKRSGEKDKDIVVSTDRSLSKAVDIRGLEVVISLNQYSSKVLSEQMVGRLRKEGDKPCTFYDFTDMGFKQCIDQRKYRKKGLTMKAKTQTTKKYF